MSLVKQLDRELIRRVFSLWKCDDIPLMTEHIIFIVVDGCAVPRLEAEEGCAPLGERPECDGDEARIREENTFSGGRIDQFHGVRAGVWEQDGVVVKHIRVQREKAAALSEAAFSGGGETQML